MTRSGKKSKEPSGENNLKQLDASRKYARFSVEQLEVLEKVYSECPVPNQSRREQIARDFPVLADVDIKQIKNWFQNRRSREKKKKEAIELHPHRKEISTINETLAEVNDRLQKQVIPLVSGEADMQQKMDSGTATNGWSCQDVITAPQHSLVDINDPVGLTSVAEETLTMFLAKATGTAVNWVPMPGMKSAPDSTGTFFISQSCSGVAARAFGLVNLNATKVAEILKDRACWFQDCRSTQIRTTTQTTNGGIIELMYTQNYAPSTLGQARDFWTLRYTTTLEDGRLVVCERSVRGNGAGPDAGMSLQFVRAEMLPSGYAILPNVGGGSVLDIVDHINFAAWDLPEWLRPLYESSEVVAQRMTIAALRYVRQLAQEATGDEVYELGRQPTILRTYSQKLSRGFNDAINGFVDDGWLPLGWDVTKEVLVSVKSSTPGTSSSNPWSIGGILCAKTTIILETLSPAVLVRFLRERRSEWADFSVDSYCAASLKASSDPHPGMRPTSFSGRQIIMSLGHTIEHEQMLELVRLEGLSVRQEDGLKSLDVHLLQMSSGMDEKSVGAYSELVFSSIDDMLPDDCCLLPSGFRIIPLIVKSGHTRYLSTRKAQGPSSSNCSVPPTISNDEGNATSPYSGQALLIMAFQFPIGGNLQKDVTSMACKYVRSVTYSVKRLAASITSSELVPDFLSRFSFGSKAQTLAQWIWQSYCSQVGGELLRGDLLGGGSTLNNLWNHQETILCCSLMAQPRFLFINKIGLNMLEANRADLKYITLDKIMSEHEMRTLKSQFHELMHRGFIWLRSGICTSTMGRRASYDYILAWKILPEDITNRCFAMSFVKMSFV